MEVEGQEQRLQLGQGLPGAEVREPEAIERDAPHLDLVAQRFDGIGAVVPHRAQRMRGAGIARVLVGHEQHPGPHALLHDPGQRLVLVRARRELRIAVSDGEGVEGPDAAAIRVGEVQAPVADLHERRRIVHHRGAPIGASREVVVEAKRVADLVGGELADARQGQLGRRYGGIEGGQDLGIRTLVRRDEAGSDGHVLANAQRAQRDVALDDLARARIGHRLPVGPSARGAMHPVHDVVAHVHGIRVLGQHAHLVGVVEAGALEGLLPPGGALHQRAADGLGGGVVDVIDDRLHDVRHRGRGILFLQAVPRDEALLQRRGERARVVVDLDAEESRAWIQPPRGVPGRRELHERVMLADGHGVRRRRHGRHQ